VIPPGEPHRESAAASREAMGFSREKLSIWKTTRPESTAGPLLSCRPNVLIAVGSKPR
jgi:hypothetical protein